MTGPNERPQRERYTAPLAEACATNAWQAYGEVIAHSSRPKTGKLLEA